MGSYSQLQNMKSLSYRIWTNLFAVISQFSLNPHQQNPKKENKNVKNKFCEYICEWLEPHLKLIYF